MASHRRRGSSSKNRLRCLIPVICIISAALFLLSFLVPVVDNDPHLRRRPPASVSVNDEVRVPGSFSVPVKASGSRSHRNLWKSINSDFYHGCSTASHKFPLADSITHPNRYLMIATSGGLNQQRTGITDAVVAARILNATLVVPKLDQKSFWKDASDFADIFNVDWFIKSLLKDVKIIKQLPRKGGKTWVPRNMRVPRKCNEKCYQMRVLPVLMKRHAVQITKFDYRLANRLDTEFQKLRCRVNYHALKFTDPILQMGRELVHRMRMRSKHYIALHLRFEPDMLAFSGCYYGGGEKERKELGAIRKRWKTLHESNPDKERRHGKCPLTPEEVALMIRALGYGSDVHIYVASGEVYGGEETLAPLKALFPNFHSKETIATKEELEQFSAFSSRMAALDFIVCDESDAFVTNNNGNMARILAGRRRYFGHKPTIRPNAKKLYRLFANRENMTWEEFSSRVRTFQRGFMGVPNEVRPGRGEFHENPSTCVCEDAEAKARKNSVPKVYDQITRSKDASESNDDDDEPDLTEPDVEEDDNALQGISVLNGTGLDYEGQASDEGELEEMLSD